MLVYSPKLHSKKFGGGRPSHWHNSSHFCATWSSLPTSLDGSFPNYSCDRAWTPSIEEGIWRVSVGSWPRLSHQSRLGYHDSVTSTQHYLEGRDWIEARFWAPVQTTTHRHRQRNGWCPHFGSKFEIMGWWLLLLRSQNFPTVVSETINVSLVVNYLPQVLGARCPIDSLVLTNYPWDSFHFPWDGFSSFNDCSSSYRITNSTYEIP